MGIYLLLFWVEVAVDRLGIWYDIPRIVPSVLIFSLINLLYGYD